MPTTQETQLSQLIILRSCTWQGSINPPWTQSRKANWLKTAQAVKESLEALYLELPSQSCPVSGQPSISVGF
ncbi:hypothetical protein SPB21_04680 [Leptothoe sp. ISB3NOV94-8A]